MPALNKENLVGRKDYGVKVARPYYDVRNCADNQLLFNSGWPILQVIGVFPVKLLRTVTPSPIQSYYQFYKDEVVSYTHCATSPTKVETGAIRHWYVWEYGGPKPSYYYSDDIYGYEHNLGYPPLAFPTNNLFNLSNHVMITNIDISKDVDYPYTDAPLEYFGGDLDYGFKTRAYWEHDMPRGNSIEGYGINSRLSSKMVQAIKTEETIDTTGGNKYINWEPPRDTSGNLVNGLDAYEYFSFGMDVNDTMGLYSPITTSYYPLNSQSNQAEYVSTSPIETLVIDKYKKQSMVIIRSPMVAPTIREVNYGS